MEFKWEDSARESRSYVGGLMLRASAGAWGWHAVVSDGGSISRSGSLGFRDEAKAWCERAAREHAAEREEKPTMLLCRPDQVETARKLLSAPLGAALYDSDKGRAVLVATSSSTARTFIAKRSIRIGDMVTSNDVEWSDESGEEVQRPSPPETNERELKPKQYPHISVGFADPANALPLPALARLLRLAPDATREQCEGRIKALLTEPMTICAEEQELRRKAVMRESDARRCCERVINDLRRVEGENHELRAALADAVLKGRR